MFKNEFVIPCRYAVSVSFKVIVKSNLLIKRNNPITRHLFWGEKFFVYYAYLPRNQNKTLTSPAVHAARSPPPMNPSVGRAVDLEFATHFSLRGGTAVQWQGVSVLDS